MALLIVGISVRSAAQSAARSGYRPIALDAFGDIDLRSCCTALSLKDEFADLFPWVANTTLRLYLCTREIEFDEVVYASGFENHPELVEGWERSGKTVLGNSSEVLRAIRNWEIFYDFLDSKGIPHPETLTLPKARDILKLDPQEASSLVVKPYKSGGGHAMRFVSELISNPSLLDGYADRVLLQRFVPGTPGSISFVSGPRCFKPLNTTRQLIGLDGSPFRYLGNVAPSGFPEKVVSQATRSAKRVAEEFGLVGSNGIDFVVSDGIVYITEVNPRLQGSLEVVEASSGVSVFDCHVKACRGVDLPRLRPSSGFWGRRVAFAPCDVTVPRLGFSFVRDVPSPGSRIKQGAPICTVTAHSSDIDGCVRLLEAREKRVISQILSRA